jgi:hypothetical protein
VAFRTTTTFVTCSQIAIATTMAISRRYLAARNAPSNRRDTSTDPGNRQYAR